MYVLSVTPGAGAGSPVTYFLNRDIPFVSIPTTAEATVSHFKVATLNVNGLAVDKGIGDLAASRLQHPMESWPRNVHLLSALFLLKAFNIL